MPNDPPQLPPTMPDRVRELQANEGLQERVTLIRTNLQEYATNQDLPYNPQGCAEMWQAYELMRLGYTRSQIETAVLHGSREDARLNHLLMIALDEAQAEYISVKKRE